MLKAFHREPNDQLCLMLMKVKDNELGSDHWTQQCEGHRRPSQGSCKGVMWGVN